MIAGETREKITPPTNSHKYKNRRIAGRFLRKVRFKVDYSLTNLFITAPRGVVSLIK